MPHHPETWPWLFGRLKRPVIMQTYLGYWNSSGPEVERRTIDAGTLVRIVMVSRFGDVGITDDLNATYGYHARVLLKDLDRV